MCFSPQGLAREYLGATKGWAILFLSLKRIRRERRGKEYPYPPEDKGSQGKRLAKSTLLFATFSSKKKQGR